MEGTPVRTVFWLSALVAPAVIGLTHTSVDAHHSSAPFYDDAQRVTIVGVVQRFVFRNPHSFLYVVSPGDNGADVEWEIEMGASVSMSRRGWTPETIAAGDTIQVVGQPSRAPGSTGMCCAELTRPDGSPIRP